MKRIDKYFLSLLFILLVFMAIMTFGCKNCGHYEKTVVKNLKYAKDHRTGLCYAVGWQRIAHIPCEKVENFLTKETSVERDQ